MVGRGPCLNHRPERERCQKKVLFVFVLERLVLLHLRSFVRYVGADPRKSYGSLERWNGGHLRTSGSVEWWALAEFLIIMSGGRTSNRRPWRSTRWARRVGELLLARMVETSGTACGLRSPGNLCPGMDRSQNDSLRRSGPHDGRFTWNLHRITASWGGTPSRVRLLGFTRT
jgi:hypothetical protein